MGCSQIPSHSLPQWDREGGGMGRNEVRKLMKQHENMDHILITVTDTTDLPWKKWQYLLPIIISAN